MIQKCVHNTMHRCFRKWSKVLLKCHCCVFTVTLLIFLLVSKYNHTITNVLRHECRELQIFWGPAVCVDTQSKYRFYFCRNSETVVLDIEHCAFYREMSLSKIEKSLKSFTLKRSQITWLKKNGISNKVKRKTMNASHSEFWVLLWKLKDLTIQLLKHCWLGRLCMPK